MNKEEITKTLINNIKLNINEQNVYEFGLCVEQWKQILDYIGELQQENQKYKEVFEKANNKLNSFIDCCKAEKLESGSDYLHHQYWDMFERFNKQIKDILKEVE